jgi:hypothetical protein
VHTKKNNVESDYGKSMWHMQPMIKIVQSITKMATKTIQNNYNLVDVTRFCLTNDENKMPPHP